MQEQMIKAILELSSTTKEANEAIEKYTKHRTIKDKLEFVKKLFPNVTLVNTQIPKSEKDYRDDYEAVLTAIINLKWG